MKTAIKSQNQRFLWKNIQAKTFKTSENVGFVLWEIPDFEWGTRYLSTEQQGKKPKAGEVIWATQASVFTYPTVTKVLRVNLPNSDLSVKS